MKKQISIADLYELETVSAPNYSSDGRFLAYVVTKLNKKNDSYQAKIILTDFTSANTKTIEWEDSLNVQPQWNSDGSKLLFLSNRSGNQQVFIYDTLQQTTQQLTNLPAGVKDVFWHPKGMSFFFTTSLSANAPASIEVLSSPTVANKIQSPFITENILYKANGTGFLDPFLQEVICSLKLCETRAQVISDYSLGYGLKKAAAIAPDGSFLVVEKALEPENPLNDDTGLFKIQLSRSDSQSDVFDYCLTEKYETGIFGEPAFSLDGRYLAMIGSCLPYQTIHQLSIYLYDFEKRKLKNVSGKLDRQVTDFCVSDFKQNTTNAQLQWSDANHVFYFVASVEGIVALYKFDPETLAVEAVRAKEEHILDFACDPVQKKLALVISAPKVPARLEIMDFQKNNSRLVTPFLNPDFDTADFADYKRVEYAAQDGGRIPGFLVLPSDLDPNKKYPLILNIHGGPYTMHGATFHHEIQLMAQQGYLVLLLNPRGSFGYGQEHLNGVLGKYGEGDYQDLMTGLDQVLADYEFIDQECLFVTGGSYGGFMTNWIVTQTNRFKAAATQRSISNFISMIGTGDIGFHFFVEESGADITQPEKLWEKSPLAFVQKVETPMLILHSEEDLRCPMEQAEQWFVGLKYLGKTARFVRFPNENHELSRTGRPSSREIRLTEIMNWFKKYTDS